MIVETKDKIRGCLIGVAVGDALGMPVETMTPEQILAETSGQGITGYATPIQRRLKGTAALPAGATTDDTQLTLAVARSLIRARGFNLRDLAAEHVQEWEVTEFGWGGTTRRAVEEMARFLDGRTDGPSRDPSDPAPRPSKPGASCGNGVAMKIAPLAIWYLRNETDLKTMEPFLTFATQFGLMTHGDPRASVAAIAVGAAIGQAMSLPEAAPDTMVTAAVRHTVGLYVSVIEARLSAYRPQPEKVSDKLRLALANLDDPVALRQAVGAGCFALESVPFALGTYLRHPTDFRAGVLEAVNAGGDTDTTGAMVGAMIGATVGLSGLPADLVDGLRNKDEVLAVADAFIAAMGC